MPNVPLAVQVDPADLELAIRSCARSQSGGRVLSVAQAVEELRIQTGDFLNSDKELANLISAAAVAQGCVVLLDGEVGPPRA